MIMARSGEELGECGTREERYCSVLRIESCGRRTTTLNVVSLDDDWPAQLAILAAVFSSHASWRSHCQKKNYGQQAPPSRLSNSYASAGAAALLVSLSDALIHRFSPGAYTELIESDPIGVIQPILANISFLGAGTIFRLPTKQHDEGLTTGASLLLSGAIGISVALRQFVLAVAVTVLTLARTAWHGLYKDGESTRRPMKDEFGGGFFAIN